MSEWIRIRIKDFYQNPVGETEYVYVSKEVYLLLAETFKKEAHAQRMKAQRHLDWEAYLEVEDKELVNKKVETLEDMIIRKIELETLQKAMQSLTDSQKERLYLYFFEGMTFRQIAEKLGISDMSVRESIEASLKKIKKFFD